MVIDVSKQFTTNDGSAVCLVNLKSFASFLTDEHGSIRRSILEPNVRDYQGKTNAVNTDIRATLNDREIQEFWWLNNGITVLSTRCSLTGDKLTVEEPEIVNGLQTTQEIFAYFKANPEKADARNVLVRVIVPPDEHIRSRITKATNFQTPVNQLSLHATDQIHFDIEEKLRLYDLFYDRRKGEYRELRKPIAKIISIRTLARAVIAISLQRPDDARARPQSLLNNNSVYNSIFNDNANRDMFVVCILIDRLVDEYLDSREDLSRDTKTDLKYYIDMWLCCELAKSRRPYHMEIAALLSHVIAPVSVEVLEKCCGRVFSIYHDLGATDTVAKGPDMRRKVIEEITSEFPPPQARRIRVRLTRDSE